MQVWVLLLIIVSLVTSRPIDQHGSNTEKESTRKRLSRQMTQPILRLKKSLSQFLNLKESKRLESGSRHPQFIKEQVKEWGESKSTLEQDTPVAQVDADCLNSDLPKPPSQSSRMNNDRMVNRENSRNVQSIHTRPTLHCLPRPSGSNVAPWMHTRQTRYDGQTRHSTHASGVSDIHLNHRRPVHRVRPFPSPIITYVHPQDIRYVQKPLPILPFMTPNYPNYPLSSPESPESPPYFSPLPFHEVQPAKIKWVITNPDPVDQTDSVNAF